MAGRFGTDGIRGLVGPQITVELALGLGRAVGHQLGGPGRSVVLGRDTRRSGEMLGAALTAGLTATGTDVVDLGVVTTPCLVHASADERHAAGIMVSASHNPAEDNGLKVVVAGRKADDAAEAELDRLIDDPSALVARSPSGQAAAYPVVETVQRDGICHEVTAPAPDLDEGLATHAQQIALRVAGELGVVGILAVELFECRTRDDYLRPSDPSHSHEYALLVDDPASERAAAEPGLEGTGGAGAPGVPELDDRLNSWLVEMAYAADAAERGDAEQAAGSGPAELDPGAGDLEALPLPRPARMPAIAEHRGDLAAALDRVAGRIDAIHCSNVLDWLAPEAAADLLERCRRRLRPGGVVIVRQLNSTVDVRACAPRFAWLAAGDRLHARERAFFYRSLHIGRA